MSDKARFFRNTLTNGILKENPILRLMIGLCPTLAVSTSLADAFGMGVATACVLVGANLTVSLLRAFIPSGVRIPIFIVVISTFVTCIDYLMQAYLPALHQSLGIFVPLIVVNCVILGRAEAFAYRNGPFLAVLDGLGMGLGFILAISLLGGIREIIGNGTILGWSVAITGVDPVLLMILPPGAFLALGFLMAALNAITKKREGAHS